jgi:hypothetical protein
MILTVAALCRLQALEMEADRPRPPVVVRALVLAGAIACLGLAMCARSERPPRNPSNSATTQRAVPDAGAPDPAYFPATKAAGPIYPQGQ